MNLELAVQIATIVTLLLTAGALLFGVWSFWKQMNCQVFLAYNDRYEKLMGSFPPGALESRLRLGETLPERSEELSICLLRYLNLCSEEFFLYRTGFLSKRIWAVWQPEIERALRSPVLKREWQRVRVEFKSHPEFFDFVEKAQASESIQPPHMTRTAMLISSEDEQSSNHALPSR
jgi:hypothetical protein